MAAMPMAAVSVRETNRSDHSPYAAVCPPGQPPVDRGGVGQHAALAGLHEHQHGLEGHRRVERRPARGVEHLGDQRPPVRDGDLERVLLPRDRLEPVATLVELAGDRLLVRCDEDRRSRRSSATTAAGCFSQPAASAPSTNWRSAGERRDVPAAADEGRLQPLRCASAATPRRSGPGPTSRPRSDGSEADRGAFAGTGPVAEVGVELRPLGRGASSVMRRSARSAAADGPPAAGRCRRARPGVPTAPRARPRPRPAPRPRAAARRTRPGRGTPAAASRARARPRPARARPRHQPDAAGHASRPSGSRHVRRATRSDRLSSWPARGRRAQGQKRVRLKPAAASSTTQITT